MISDVLAERVRKTRAVLLDMDGVVYLGDMPLPGVQDFLDYLEATGRKWLCVTNNSSKTPDMFVDKLAKMNVRATAENVLGSAVATANWMANAYPQKGKALMVGEEGLSAALEAYGFEMTANRHAADFVVAGIDFDLTYAKVERAALAIRDGAIFVGTNSDPSFPNENGQVPGAGSILALLATATGVEPTVIGKPNAGMFDMATTRLGVTAEETMMVGDRYDTDIAGAIGLDMTTVGVLTGVTTAEGYAQEDPPPDIVLHGIPDLLALFKEVDNSS
mgnify:CR=1 FL=1